MKTSKTLKNLKSCVLCGAASLAVAFAGVTYHGGAVVAASSDLPSAWAQSTVSGARENGLLPSKFTTKYQSDITRREFAQLVTNFYVRLSGNQVPEQIENPFADMQPADNDVSFAYQLGIIKGVSENEFAPDRSVTREELAAMLSRTFILASDRAEMPEQFYNSFPDQGSISEWALKDVLYMNLAGAIYGNENYEFMPKSNTTVEQAIAMVLRLFYREDTDSKYDVRISQFNESSSFNANVVNKGFAVCHKTNLFCYADDKIINADLTTGNITELGSFTGVKNLYLANDVLYFTQNIDGTDQIFKINTDGSNQIRLAEVDAEYLYLVSGRVYFINKSDRLLYCVPANGGEVVLALDIPMDMACLVASNVYYIADGEIKLASLNGGVPETLYTGGAHMIENAGETSVRFLDSDNYLKSIDLATSEVTQLAGFPVKSYNSGLSARYIYASCDDGIYKIESTGKGAVKIHDASPEYISCFREQWVFGLMGDGSIMQIDRDSGNYKVY